MRETVNSLFWQSPLFWQIAFVVGIFFSIVFIVLFVKSCKERIDDGIGVTSRFCMSAFGIILCIPFFFLCNTGMILETKSYNSTEISSIEVCPSCGSEASLCSTIEGSEQQVLYFVECTECKVSTGKYGTKSEAADVWNSLK